MRSWINLVQILDHPIWLRFQERAAPFLVDYLSNSTILFPREAFSSKSSPICRYLRCAVTSLGIPKVFLINSSVITKLGTRIGTILLLKARTPKVIVGCLLTRICARYFPRTHDTLVTQESGLFHPLIEHWAFLSIADLIHWLIVLVFIWIIPLNRLHNNWNLANTIQYEKCYG